MIDDLVTNLVVAQILFLQHESATADIHLYVSSPGGSVTASLAIYDTMMFVKNDVAATYCTGRAEGTAALLLCSGEKGKRFALPHARIGFAEIWGGTRGSEAERRIQAEEIAKLKRAVFEIYAKHTGASFESMEREHGTGDFSAPKRRDGAGSSTKSSRPCLTRRRPSPITIVVADSATAAQAARDASLFRLFGRLVGRVW